MIALDLSAYIAYFGIFAGILGISWVSRDYLSSLIGGLILRRIRRLKPGTRIKIMGNSHVIKGDILDVEMFRTALAEVGDGERLPGIRTGRVYLVPNSALINNPVLMYGRKIVDQVIVYVESDPEEAVRCMQEAMKLAKVKPKEVDVYQTSDRFVIYGIYESRTKNVSDTRSDIMKTFFKLWKNRMPGRGIANKLHLVEKSINKVRNF